MVALGVGADEALGLLLGLAGDPRVVAVDLLVGRRVDGDVSAEGLGEQVEHRGRAADVAALDVDDRVVGLVVLQVRERARAAVGRVQRVAQLDVWHVVVLVARVDPEAQRPILVGVADDVDQADGVADVRVHPVDDVGERAGRGDERRVGLVDAPEALGEGVEAVRVVAHEEDQAAPCGGRDGRGGSAAGARARGRRRRLAQQAARRAVSRGPLQPEHALRGAPAKAGRGSRWRVLAAGLDAIALSHRPTVGPGGAPVNRAAVEPPRRGPGAPPAPGDHAVSLRRSLSRGAVRTAATRACPGARRSPAGS